MNILLITYFVSVVATLIYLLRSFYRDWSLGFDITFHDTVAAVFVVFAPLINTLFILHHINITDWTMIKGKKQ